MLLAIIDVVHRYHAGLAIDISGAHASLGVDTIDYVAATAATVAAQLAHDGFTVPHLDPAVLRLEHHIQERRHAGECGLTGRSIGQYSWRPGMIDPDLTSGCGHHQGGCRQRGPCPG